MYAKYISTTLEKGGVKGGEWLCGARDGRIGAKYVEQTSLQSFGQVRGSEST